MRVAFLPMARNQNRMMDFLRSQEPSETEMGQPLPGGVGKVIN